MKTIFVIETQSQAAKILGMRRPWKVGSTFKDKRNDYKRKPKFGKGWD